MTVLRHFTFKKSVSRATTQTLCEFLAEHSGLSKGKVKDAMTKGAVTVSKKGGKRRRVRRATAPLAVGDKVEFHYDEALLAITPPVACCLDDRKRYSLWFKPAGLMTQGTDYGDHCALLRQVEGYFRPQRPVFLIHRLDREAAGLVLIAHDGEAAARLSALFRDNLIDKRYRVRVRGAVADKRGEISLPLDGKPALTRYTVAAYDAEVDETALEVTIATGRLHQIRRHFAMIGHPVLGDPKYGSGNKNKTGLQLTAMGLRFHCPFSGGERDYVLNETVNGLL